MVRNKDMIKRGAASIKLNKNQMICNSMSQCHVTYQNQMELKKDNINQYKDIIIWFNSIHHSLI